MAAALVVLALLLSLFACATMLWQAYRPRPRAGAEPMLELPGLDPCVGLAGRIRSRLERLGDPAIQLALGSRLELGQILPEAEKQLLVMELACDVDRLLHEAGMGDPGSTGVAEHVVDLPLEDREAAVLQQIDHGLERRLVALLGAERSRRVLAAAGERPGTHEEWRQFLERGELRRWLARLVECLERDLGLATTLTQLEGVLRDVGRRFPLSCLPTVLAALPEGCLSAEKSYAAARDQMWQDYLQAHRDLGAVRVRLAEVELNKWASIGRLAAGVAHEINNPLTFVLGNLELGRSTVSAAGTEAAELLATMNDALEGVDRIREIVNDLQVFARPDSEPLTEVALDELADSMAHMARAELRGHVSLVREYATTPPVVAKRGRIGQVLMNLIINATQALPEGARDNRLTLRTGCHAWGSWVEVEDNGPGIASEVLPHIFDPFYTTKPTGKGTGLGLAISREIVATHGGDLTVRSRAGEGTVFRVSLPNTGPSRGDDRKARIAPAPPSRVLIVDDEAPVRQALERILGDRHDVTTVASGAGALELMDRVPPFDVIFLDMVMPEMSGEEVYRRLCDQFPDTAERVVFVTGGATNVKLGAFLCEYAERTIYKPVRKQDLSRAIAHVRSLPSPGEPVDSRSTP